MLIAAGGRFAGVVSAKRLEDLLKRLTGFALLGDLLVDIIKAINDEDRYSKDYCDAVLRRVPA